MGEGLLSLVVLFNVVCNQGSRIANPLDLVPPKWYLLCLCVARQSCQNKKSLVKVEPQNLLDMSGSTFKLCQASEFAKASKCYSKEGKMV